MDKLGEIMQGNILLILMDNMKILIYALNVTLIQIKKQSDLEIDMKVMWNNNHD
jgi:hypothetical protein